MYVARAIEKRFAGVHALRGVDLDVQQGEVQAILGANGAGKSTLVKILAGAMKPDAGELMLDGRPVAFRSTRGAGDAGVAIVSQELNLFPELDVLSNLYLPRPPRRRGLMARRNMSARARPVLERLGLRTRLDRRLGDLPLPEQQIVEIARALLTEPKVLILDEPNSALKANETERLLAVVRTLRDEGVAILLVSHLLEQVFGVADQITVLRDGEVVAAHQPTAELTIPEVVRLMVGDREGAIRTRTRGREVSTASRPLALRGVSVPGTLEDVSFEAHSGEIVGLVGLEGAGHSAVLEVLFGARKISVGEISLPDGRAGATSITGAVTSRIALVTGDRKAYGLMLEHSIASNVGLVGQGVLGRRGTLVRARKQALRAGAWAQELGIAMRSPAAAVGELSGGNQQKVVFAKWLEAGPSIVLLDDPTRGMDVGARADVHRIINDLADQGRVVILTSSELDEVAQLADRALVFVRGRLRECLGADRVNEHDLLTAINAES